MDALEKSLRISNLYDLYQGLLTDKQCAYIEAYYFDDLSISEISENFEVSRNAVFDQLKRAEKKLEEIESKLNVLQKSVKRQELLNKAKELASDELMVLLEELEKVE